MLDRERADFFRALDSLKDAFGPHVVATEIPIGSEHESRGIVDLIDMKAFEYDGSGGRGEREARSRSPTRSRPRPTEYREKLMDEVAENSDELMERYLEGEEISHDEIVVGAQGRRHGRHDLPRHLRRRDQEPRHRPAARRAGQRPALAGAQGRGHGARRRRATRSRSSPTRTASPIAYVFKTLADPFAGRINLFRVYSGMREARLAADQRARPLARSASASCWSHRARRWATRTSSAPATSARSRS